MATSALLVFQIGYVSAIVHVFDLVLVLIIQHPPHQLDHFPPGAGGPPLQPDDDLGKQSQDCCVRHPGCIGGTDRFVGVCGERVHCLSGGKGLPCKCSHCWNLAVSNGFKSVHPRGHPISHSTHTGFMCPPTRLSLSCSIMASGRFACPLATLRAVQSDAFAAPL